MDSDEDDNPNKRFRIIPAYDCPDRTGEEYAFLRCSCHIKQEQSFS